MAAKLANIAGIRAESAFSVPIRTQRGKLLAKMPHSATNAATIPANTTIVNSLVDSQRLTNAYDGIVVLDAYGQAAITLPGSFNIPIDDIRYHLTPLGAYAPLFIASEMIGNTFRIGGGTPGLRVSWSVSGTQRNLNTK